MKKKIAIAALAAAMAAGLIFIPPLAAQLAHGSNSGGAPEGPGAGPGGAGARPSGGQTVFTVKTEEAETRNLLAYLEINGDIVSDEQVTVYPEASGKLSSIRIALGSYIRRGQLVAEVDPSRPGTEYALSPVYAPVSGTVLSNPVAAGSTVSTTSALFTVGTSGSLAIEALIPEREVGQLRIGLEATVRLEAFPSEVFKAKLVKLSPVVDPVSRTKKVSLRFTTADSRINAGMFARIKLNTRAYPNVISIPENAVVDSRGKQTVFVVDAASAGEDGTVRVIQKEVVTGVSIDGELEIKSGLESGEQVVTQGQRFVTNGARVRVL